MVDEVMQEDIKDEELSNIDDILASPDDEDIMKDFNFDDILENPENNTIGNTESEDERPAIPGNDYSVNNVDEVFDKTEDVNENGQSFVMEENGDNIEGNVGGVEQDNEMLSVENDILNNEEDSGKFTDTDSIKNEEVGEDSTNADANIWDNNVADIMPEEEKAVNDDVWVEGNGSGYPLNEDNAAEFADTAKEQYDNQISEAPEDDYSTQETVLNENGLMSQAAKNGDEYIAVEDNFSPLSGLDEVPGIGFLREYDGGLSDNVYSISKGFESADFNGNENCNTIHVNVGYDTYGWNVEFANSVMMSLRDVKEYQKRQGCLPFNSGTIRYGNKVLRFRDIKRIVVYESVKYFSYGA